MAFDRAQYERKCIAPLPPNTDLIRQEHFYDNSGNRVATDFFHEAKPLQFTSDQRTLRWVCRRTVTTPQQQGGKPLDQVVAPPSDREPSRVEAFAEIGLPSIVSDVTEAVKKTGWMLVVGAVVVVTLLFALKSR